MLIPPLRDRNNSLSETAKPIPSSFSEAARGQRDPRPALEPGEEVGAPRAEQLHPQRVHRRQEGRAQLRARQEQGAQAAVGVQPVSRRERQEYGYRAEHRCLKVIVKK